jgi:cytochrome c biogenesis protein CcdA
MFRPIAIMLVVVSAILIVYGRVNRRSRWGDWIAVAGFAVLVLAGVLALLSGR